MLVALSIQPRDRLVSSTAFHLLGFLAYALVFGLIYAQSPLYTSNQNQYFLHGLAQAGVGWLERDWLANTLDPTPVFSGLIRLTYQLFITEVLFYAYYAVLMAFYLVSVLGIVRQLFGFQDRAGMFVFLAIFLLTHSAALRFFLSRTLGDEWTFLFEGGIANQRLLGQVFQPSTFGVFLVLSIYLFMMKKEFLAVGAQAIAVFFHPTYLLSTALLTLAYLWAMYREAGQLQKTIRVAFLALVLVLPMIGYVYWTFGSSPPEIAAAARDILVNIRIPHHALLATWFNLTTVVQLALLGAALFLARQSRLFHVMLVTTGLALLLTLLQAASGNAALALLFPWRISVILIPLATSIIFAKLVSWGMVRFRPLSDSQHNMVLMFSLALILVLALVGITRFRLELERKTNAPERELMAYVAKNKAAEDLYLIPIKMQDFRLATGAPVYVEFKSIPYRDAEVLEWHRRVGQATRFYSGKAPDCTILEGMVEIEGVTQVVLKNPIHAICPGMVQEYEDAQYAIYRVAR
ncbi:MAG TPA: DUF6798 domain-containing protein [Anaerolineales bacterium]|nr:DUF6798 domain-containing protein [Anaerolineales bacterium]